MSERAQAELLRGQGAHTDPIACIEDVDLGLANSRIEKFPHAIADLVFHMNYWMNHELRRIRGEKPAYPSHNAESFPSSQSDAEAWSGLKRDFAWFLSEFAKLAEFGVSVILRVAAFQAKRRISRAERSKQQSRVSLPPEELARQVESIHDADKKVSATVEAIVWQMVAHNSYHTGQIAQIRRALGAWPPKAGGDSG